MQEMSPNKVQKILISQESLVLSKVTKRLRQFPWELAIISRTLDANRVQSTFLSGHILGASSLIAAKPTSQDTNGYNHYFYLFIFLLANLNSKRKKQCKILSSPLAGPIERDLGDLTLVRILAFSQLLSVFPGSDLQDLEQLGCFTGSHPGQQKL